MRFQASTGGLGTCPTGKGGRCVRLESCSSTDLPCDLEPVASGVWSSALDLSRPVSLSESGRRQLQAQLRTRCGPSVSRQERWLPPELVTPRRPRLSGLGEGRWLPSQSWGWVKGQARRGPHQSHKTLLEPSVCFQWEQVGASSSRRARSEGLRGQGRLLWAGLCEIGLNADGQQVGGTVCSLSSQQIKARSLEHPECSKRLILIRVLCAHTKAHLAWGVRCSGSKRQ